MSALLARIEGHARQQPDAVALADGQATLSYRELVEEIRRLAGLLAAQRVGLLLDNGMAWACLDLALRRAGAVCVPMPGFFSPGQQAHLLHDAGLELIVTDAPERAAELLGDGTANRIEAAGRPVWLFRPAVSSAGKHRALPPGTAKVTYTSGTTGSPKGVCLSGEDIEAVAASLAEIVAASPDDRALSLLPLSTLLENIGGLYAPLWVGGRAQLPALAECGMAGSSGLDPLRLFAALLRFAPTTVILVPQLLKALVEVAAVGQPVPSSLRFAAVGGAPVSAGLLARARSLAIPAYQGYGLSEAASVVCLNLPGAEREGSVGRPLPGLHVSVTAEGEVMVGGRVCLGYLGGAPAGVEAWATGDLGYLDADGFLHLTGRRKTAYATAFGRNVAPEWVESELTGQAGIAQAAVFGDGRPFNVAVLVPRSAPEAMAAAVAAVNRRLPDYARIGRWLVADAPFTVGNGLVNGAGALVRSAVAAQYQKRIDQLFEKEEMHDAV